MSATEAEAMDTTPVSDETKSATEEVSESSETTAAPSAPSAPAAPAEAETPAAVEGKTPAASEEPTVATTETAPVVQPSPAETPIPAAAPPIAVELPKVTPQPSTPVVLTDSLQKLISEEKEAINMPKAKADVQSLPTRQYLDQSVVPILLQGLTALSKERPAEPIDFLAAYLMKNKHMFQKSM